MVAPVVALAFARTLAGVFGRSASRATVQQRAATSRLLKVLGRGFKRLPKVTGIKNPIEPNLTVEKQIDKKFRMLIRVYTAKLLDNLARETARRRNRLINMVLYGAHGRRGSSINSTGTQGLIASDLFRKVRDPKVVGELGFPGRFNPQASLIKALKQSIITVVTRPRYNHFVMRFILDYNRMRRLTPHPAAKMEDGRNIKVMSWLDWLHGDAIVTDAGFVSLAQLRGAKPSKRPLSPRSSGIVGPQYTGWMISPTKKTAFKKRMANRGSPAKRRGQEKSSVSLPTSWRISTPVNKNWVTERSLSIGIGLLDLYAGGLIQRVHNRTIKNFTAIV